jgi:hypothetical protein
MLIKINNPSFRRKPESRNLNGLQNPWIPAFAGMTGLASGGA